MAIELVTKNTPDYLNSGYLFSKNPLFWEFQRADLKATQVTNIGGFANFVSTQANTDTAYLYLKSLIGVTAEIYVKGDTYNGIYTVTNVVITPIAGGERINITTDAPFIGSDECYILLTNLDTWNVQFQLTIYKDEQIELTNKIVSFTDGTFAINVQDFINKYIDYRNNWQYNLINWNDKDMSVNAKIEALINYRGNKDIKTQVIDTKTFIYGANQSVNQYK